MSEDIPRTPYLVSTARGRGDDVVGVFFVRMGTEDWARYADWVDALRFVDRLTLFEDEVFEMGFQTPVLFLPGFLEQTYTGSMQTLLNLPVFGREQGIQTVVDVMGPEMVPPLGLNFVGRAMPDLSDLAVLMDEFGSVGGCRIAESEWRLVHNVPGIALTFIFDYPYPVQEFYTRPIRLSTLVELFGEPPAPRRVERW